jgi:hypothetical protein
MEKLANRQAGLTVFAALLIGMCLGGLFTYFSSGAWVPGTSPGALVGLAVGGLLTRQARPQFAIPLLLIVGAGLALVAVLLWRAGA